MLDPLLSWLELWKVLFLVWEGVWLDEGVRSLCCLGWSCGSWRVLFLVRAGACWMRVLDPLLSWLEMWKVLFLVVTGAWLHEDVGSLAVLAGAVEGLVSGGDRSLAG